MKRITFITGHYGSGKSEFSVNLAISKKVDMIIDLDIVNPYFRSRELEKLFTEKGIKVVSSTVDAKASSDLPFISPVAFSPFYNKDIRAIIDLGGDPVGAKLLRQYKDLINDEIDLLMCINIFREETSTVEKILKMVDEIVISGGLKITGLINNSNLLRETTADDILRGQNIIREVASRLGLKIIYTSAYENVNLSHCNLDGEVMPLKLYLRKTWL